MRRIKALGAVLVAVFAIGAMATSGASAHEFKSSTTHDLILRRSLFLFRIIGIHIHCELELHILVLTTATRLWRSRTHYRSCVFSVGSATAKADEPIETEDEFDAEGTTTILKSFTILASIAGTKCTITIPAQGPLSGVAYDNTVQAGKEKILMLQNVTNLESSVTGAACGGSGTSKTGLFTNTSLLEEETGNIKWV